MYHHLPAEYVLKWLKEYTRTSMYKYMYINYCTLTLPNSFIRSFFYQYTPILMVAVQCCFMFPSTPAFTNIGVLGFFTNLHKHIQNIPTK